MAYLPDLPDCHSCASHLSSGLDSLYPRANIIPQKVLTVPPNLMLSEQTSGGAARSDQEWHHSVSSLGPLAGQGTLGAVIVDLPEIGEETAYNIYAGTLLTLVLDLSPKAIDMMISLFLPGVYRVHEPCCSFSYLN